MSLKNGRCYRSFSQSFSAPVTVSFSQPKCFHRLLFHTILRVWTKNGRTVRIVRPSKPKWPDGIRITWREDWKLDHVVICDYSKAEGPTCLIPVNTLFRSQFIERKRKTKAYENSGYWWTQILPIDHDLSKLILRYQDRWGILSDEG